MAKCFASEQAFDAAVNAVQIHGANGVNRLPCGEVTQGREGSAGVWGN